MRSAFYEGENCLSTGNIFEGDNAWLLGFEFFLALIFYSLTKFLLLTLSTNYYCLVFM